MPKVIATTGVFLLLLPIVSCRQSNVTSAKQIIPTPVPVQRATAVPKEKAATVQPAPALEPQQSEADPHRPPCLTASCRKIGKFLKDHYCGESPFGNGPEDGCEYKEPVRTGGTLTVSYHCDWDESAAKSTCRQIGLPSANQRDVLLSELRRIGLPAQADQEVTYTVIQSLSGWTLMSAHYHHSDGPDLDVCEIVVALDQASNLHIVRSVKLQKTNSDVSDLISWSPLDIADVNGDGQVEFVLRGDAYEDHWLEVVKIQDDSEKTIFSGLGYYL